MMETGAIRQETTAVHDVLNLFRDKIVHDVMNPDSYYTENGHKLRISGKENEDSDKIGE